jgi:hypothetical protein
VIPSHTLDQLKTLRMDGMVAALADQAISSAAAELGFDERLSLLVQREMDWRDDKRLTRLLKAAKLKVSSASIEDIIWRDSRNLDRHLVTSLAGCDWVRHSRTVLLTGPLARAKPGWGAPWPDRPRVAASAYCMPAPRASCRNCAWPTARAGSPVAWHNWPE